MKAIEIYFFACVVLALSACSEPGKEITRSTGDGKFKVTLKAAQNWIYPGHSLLVQVRIQSLTGPVQGQVDEEIKFVANNGQISPSTLFVSLAGPDDEGNGAAEVFTGWITFEANDPLAIDSRTGNSSGIGTEHQGEVHAFFRDVLTTLKIRIAAPPESL